MRWTHAAPTPTLRGMKLYFSPLACSLASRITALEADLDLTFVEVDPKTKHTEDGADFHTVHPLGLVPALALDDGRVLTENAAVLQLLADTKPDAGLAPPAGTFERARLHEWLSFVGTELHKALYFPLLDKTTPAAAREYALAKRDSRLAHVASALDGRDYLLGRFSVADAYLFTVLHWSVVTPIDLSAWPTLTAFMARMHARPNVARAVALEKDLYVRELARAS